MKKNIKYLLIISVSIVVGVSLGALFFGVSSENQPISISHDHSDETETWTCSMHPQVRQTEPGSCPFCGMDLIPLGNSESLKTSSLALTKEAVALANIQTSTVGKNAVQDQIILNGKLKYDARFIQSQTTHFGGRIERLLKTYEGEKVKEGEPIAYIYSPELVAAQEELLAAKAVASSNPMLFASTKKKLKLLKLTEEQIEQIITNDEIIEEFPLLAEYNGVLTKMMVNNGEHIMEGTTLFEVSDANKLWAVFDVYEKDINKINIGDEIDFSFNNGTESFSSTISFISPEVDPSTRAIEVRGNLTNNGKLKVDMFMKGAIQPSNSENESITVPRSAVLWTGKHSIVYVKTAGELVFEMRTVELGDRIADHYEVLSGLSSGEEVVTNGTFILDAEAQLQGKISMMNAANTSPSKASSFLEITLDAPLIATEETPKYFQTQLQQIMRSYISLKDELVASSSSSISKEAAKLSSLLQSVEDEGLGEESKSHWTVLKATMASSLSKIESTDQRENQRLEFINLSKVMINMLKSFSIEIDGPIYIQHCPMANNDKGADWISLTENIINPYFGEVMLTCGYTEEIIKN